MAGIIAIAVRLVEASTRAYEKKWTFFGISAVVFFVNVLVLGALGLLPELPKASAEPVVVLSASSDASVPATPVVRIEEPVKIVASTIGLAATIANPTTTNIEALDEELLKGAVRYPTGAMLGEEGNVVLFAHSSYLPVVGNQAYKTFNGIQKLVVGDVIEVSSENTTYVYRVRSVVKASADDAGINLAVTGRVLTLATCNSFGTKSDRFVVTADFVESHAISS